MKTIHALVAMFQTPRGYLLGVLLAGLVALPTLAFGLFVDDYVHLYTIEDGALTFATRWDIFNFASGSEDALKPYLDTGPFPWYTLPDINLHFFRPLSSALMTLDRTLFGRQFPLYHAHSILWYVLLAAGVALVFRRSLPGGLGVLALVLYAVDEAHFVPVGWWSNRNAVVAVAPALLGFAAHLRWREDGWRPGLPLSLLGYGIGLLAGETALGVMGYLGAYELLGDRHSLKSRITALVPAALLSFGYLFVYKLSGYGVYGSGIYLDPLSEPVAFLMEAPSRLAQLIGLQFFMMPVELAVAVHALETPMAILSAVLFSIVAVLLWRLWPGLEPETRRGLRWLLAGAVLSTAPVLATFPSGRLMLLPSIGGAAAIAIVIHAWWRQSRESKMLRATAMAFVGLHLLLPLVLWPGATLFVRGMQQITERAVFATEIDESRAADLKVTVVTAPDPFMGFYPVIVRVVYGRALSESWQTLSIAPHTHRLTRTAENAFELETVEGAMLQTIFEQLFRSPDTPFAVGEQVELTDVTVTVLEVNEVGPTKIGVEYATSLDAEDRLFLVWDYDHLARLEFPPVGSTIEIENQGGLFSLDFMFGEQRAVTNAEGAKTN